MFQTFGVDPGNCLTTCKVKLTYHTDLQKNSQILKPHKVIWDFFSTGSQKKLPYTKASQRFCEATKALSKNECFTREERAESKETDIGDNFIFLLCIRADPILGRTGKLAESFLLAYTNVSAVISRGSGNVIPLAWIHILITLRYVIISKESSLRINL